MTKQPKKSQKQQIVELTDDLKRLQAEFINYKRRSEEDKQRALFVGKENAFKTLLPIIDNLDRAIAHQPDDIKNHPWAKGVASVAKQLESELKTAGLEKYGVVGEVFNPEIHDAVSMLEGDGETEVIAGVAQPGYMLDGLVLRHAVVQVGKQ
jgi:molecular chaperone GrpE